MLIKNMFFTFSDSNSGPKVTSSYFIDQKFNLVGR